MKSKGKKIIDAKEDADHNISTVLLKGNKTFTPIKTAIDMAKRGEIDAVHVKKSQHTKEHIRTRPDDKKQNNLDDMAEDKK
jgi:hypothetical protein